VKVLNQTNKTDRLSFDVDLIRSEFPILQSQMNGKKLIYLDNAASMQKPQEVIDVIDEFYSKAYSNVHRSVHRLSYEATIQYEGVRKKVCRWIGTKNPNEIIFTKGATESINLVARSLGNSIIQSGDSILVSRMEHHANFVPWQSLAKEKSLCFQIVELDDQFKIDQKDFREKLKSNPKIIALSLMSNVLGNLCELNDVIAEAKSSGALVLIDAAQSVAHAKLDLSQLGDIDFLVFSAHKIGGPTGVGVLWAKEELLNQMPPYQFGGDMILDVSDEESLWADGPHKFEAGTPNIAGVIGFGAALDFLSSIDWTGLEEHERKLTAYAFEKLEQVPGLKLFGPKLCEARRPIFSFEMSKVHPHDLGTFLDHHGIAVRAGHHCAQPLHRHFKLGSTTRASFCFYNQISEVATLTNALEEAWKFFRAEKNK